jgi:hypothetical protein
MWRFNSTQRGKPLGIRVEPILSSNDGEVTHAWALAGAGVIIRSEWDVADDLRAGRLVRVLTDWKLPPANIVALMGTRHGRSARTARFLEHLHSMLTPVPLATTRNHYSRPSGRNPGAAGESRAGINLSKLLEATGLRFPFAETCGARMVVYYTVIDP